MLDGWGAPAILPQASIRQMVTPVFPTPDWNGAGQISIGLGIGVILLVPMPYGRTAAAPFGTLSFACRMGHGWAWAAIFNSATRDSLYSTTGAPDFDAALSRIFIRDALQSVSWLNTFLPAGRRFFLRAS